ncbi:PE domain-containing protein [Lentzea flaviverrucosa]|uniref:PE family protein n=1 Tax=Lentzea flaviverrucosa TaxID=200379 RepID=A0A1H9XPE7_9PSEU|nr:PE domain-containing protein [Lentzea flaviverrucosa]RDI19721.1 PE family protein [Lentzea flaviverrucosa]SES48022.1 PE family protein [Lentzea flaviverrucosa]
MSGIKVDLETLRAAIKEYEAIRDELAMAHHDGHVLATVQGAGKDAPSQVYANWARATGAAHQRSNKQLQDTLTTRIENLNATLRQYEQTEQGNRDNLK